MPISRKGPIQSQKTIEVSEFGLRWQSDSGDTAFESFLISKIPIYSSEVPVILVRKCGGLS